MNATKRTDIFLIDPRNIVVMDDFNCRREFDLDELKEQIKAKGVLNPLTVIPYKNSWTWGDEIKIKCKICEGTGRLDAHITIEWKPSKSSKV